MPSPLGELEGAAELGVAEPPAGPPRRVATASRRRSILRLGVGRVHGDSTRGARRRRSVRRELLPLLRGGRLLPSRGSRRLDVLVRRRCARRPLRGCGDGHQERPSALACVLVRLAPALLPQELRRVGLARRRPASLPRPRQPVAAPSAGPRRAPQCASASPRARRAISSPATFARSGAASGPGSSASGAGRRHERANRRRRDRPQRGRAPGGEPGFGARRRTPGRVRRLRIERRQRRAWRGRCAIASSSSMRRARFRRRRARNEGFAALVAAYPVDRVFNSSTAIARCCRAGSKRPRPRSMPIRSVPSSSARCRSGTPRRRSTTGCARSSGSRAPGELANFGALGGIMFVRADVFSRLRRLQRASDRRRGLRARRARRRPPASR